jgi:hypothetical protein
MLKRTERLVIAVVIFVVSVLVLTRIDFLINSDLYHYGLQFSDGWFWINQVTYTAMYQIIIVCLFLYSRSKWLLITFEAFVISAGQDLVYFTVWQRSFPNGNWDWMPAVKVFGLAQWTTAMQIGTTFATMLAVSMIWYFFRKRL